MIIRDLRKYNGQIFLWVILFALKKYIYINILTGYNRVTDLMTIH